MEARAASERLVATNKVVVIANDCRDNCKLQIGNRICASKLDCAIMRVVEQRRVVDVGGENGRAASENDNELAVGNGCKNANDNDDDDDAVGAPQKVRVATEAVDKPELRRNGANVAADRNRKATSGQVDKENNNNNNDANVNAQLLLQTNGSRKSEDKLTLPKAAYVETSLDDLIYSDAASEGRVVAQLFFEGDLLLQIDNSSTSLALRQIVQQDCLLSRCCQAIELQMQFYY